MMRVSGHCRISGDPFPHSPDAINGHCHTAAQRRRLLLRALRKQRAMHAKVLMALVLFKRPYRLGSRS
jgi:hypothetical protein